MLKLLRHNEVTIEYGKLMASTAEATWDDLYPPTKFVIKIDRNQCTAEMSDTILVVHELIHAVLSEMFWRYVSEDLEEIMVLALEKEFNQYINKKPSRIKAWQKAIQSKLEKQEKANAKNGDAHNTV